MKFSTFDLLVMVGLLLLIGMTARKVPLNRPDSTTDADQNILDLVAAHPPLNNPNLDNDPGNLYGI